MKIDDSYIQANFEVELMAHGYHCFSTIWNAVIGEELPEDKFTVTVCKCEIIAGHIPKRKS